LALIRAKSALTDKLNVSHQLIIVKRKRGEAILKGAPMLVKTETSSHQMMENQMDDHNGKTWYKNVLV